MNRSEAVQSMLIACVALLVAGSLPAAEGVPTTVAEPTAAGTAAGKEVTAAAQAPVTPPSKDEEVTIDVVETEISDVVKMFTRLPNVNIVVGTNLTGKVTAHIKAPWKAALDAVLELRGLRLDDPQGEGVYRIVQRSNVEPLVTETIFLRFAEVPSVITVLKNGLDPRGKIADFSSRNAMVIQSTQRNLSEIRAIVEQIDIPRRQVFIEAQFVELSSSSESNIGIGWDKMLKSYEIGGSMQPLNSSETIVKTDTRTDTLNKSAKGEGVDVLEAKYDVRGSTLSPSAGAAASTGGGSATPGASASARTRTLTDTQTKNLTANGLAESVSTRILEDVRTAVLNPLQFNLVLSALKSRGGTTILSKPKIIVANGEQAMIHIGEERRPFIATVSPATTTTAPFTTYNPGNPVQFGVKIVVTPTINTGSNITVMIEPELTRLAGIDTAPDGKTSYPITATKKIKTQFTLENYRTAAIGGLTETSNDKGSDKVPVLSDIPLIGKYLFSHETDSRKQQEMIIFVTVGIVSPEAADDKVGIPSDAELIKTYKLERSAELERFQNDIEGKQADAEKRTEKAEKRKKLILNRVK